MLLVSLLLTLAAAPSTPPPTEFHWTFAVLTKDFAPDKSWQLDTSHPQQSQLLASSTGKQAYRCTLSSDQKYGDGAIEASQNGQLSCELQRSGTHPDEWLPAGSGAALSLRCQKWKRDRKVTPHRTSMALIFEKDEQVLVQLTCG